MKQPFPIWQFVRTLHDTSCTVTAARAVYDYATLILPDRVGPDTESRIVNSLTFAWNRSYYSNRSVFTGKGAAHLRLHYHERTEEKERRGTRKKIKISITKQKPRRERRERSGIDPRALPKSLITSRNWGFLHLYLFIAPLLLRSSPFHQSNLTIQTRPGTELFAPGPPVRDAVRSSLAHFIAQGSSRSREEEGKQFQNSAPKRLKNFSFFI